MAKTKRTKTPRLADRLRAVGAVVRDRRVLVALIAAAGVTLAVGTFAAGGNQGGNTVWQAQGSDAVRCAPKRDKQKNPCQKQGGSITAKGRYKVEFKVPDLKDAVYKMRVVYRTTGERNGEHKLIIGRNGRAVDSVKLPPSVDNYTYISDTFAMKGSKRLTVDLNPARGSQVVIERVALKEVPNALKSGSSRGYADRLLAEGNKQGGRVSLNGETRDNLQRIRDGGCSPVPISNACVKLDKRLLRGILTVSQKRKLGVWHFTEGPHVTCSNHYEGRAVDLTEYDGSWPRDRSVLGMFQKLGADELIGPGQPNHDDHWHVAWEGTHQYCAN